MRKLGMIFNVFMGSNNRKIMPTPHMGVDPITGTPNSLFKAFGVPNNSEAGGSGMSENIELQNLILTLQQQVNE